MCPTTPRLANLFAGCARGVLEINQGLGDQRQRHSREMARCRAWPAAFTPLQLPTNRTRKNLSKPAWMRMLKRAEARAPAMCRNRPAAFTPLQLPTNRARKNRSRPAWMRRLKRAEARAPALYRVCAYSDLTFLTIAAASMPNAAISSAAWPERGMPLIASLCTLMPSLESSPATASPKPPSA